MVFWALWTSELTPPPQDWSLQLLDPHLPSASGSSLVSPLPGHRTQKLSVKGELTATLLHTIS